MRNTFAFVALLAATAAVPAYAEGGHHDFHGGGNRGGGAPAPRAQAAPPAQHFNGGGQRGQFQGGNPGFQQARQAQQTQAYQPRQFNAYRGGGRPQGFVQQPAAAVQVAQHGQSYQRGGNGDRSYGQQGYDRRDQQFDGNRGNGYDRGRYDDHRFSQGGRGYDGYRGGAFNRDWRRDERYDWQGYRAANRFAFHVNQYYAPYGYGYGYQRFGIGFALDAAFFDQQYWIGDPYEYRLPPVDGPYRWVRYYNDVLLIDVRDGQVVDAIYDFFW